MRALKYYDAYNERYRQVHEQELQWFDKDASPIVYETICNCQISVQDQLLEIGCGEGRDAFPLIKTGFDLLAIDVSPEAIAYCRSKMPECKECFQVLDCVTEKLDRRFDFIYAVAVIHMLVPDEDRNGFYQFVWEHLKPNGIALICTMGDGISEYQSDISGAFHIQERLHKQSGKTVQIAATSFRMVSFQTFEAEIRRNGLELIHKGTTAIEPDFPQIMYAVVRRRDNEAER